MNEKSKILIIVEGAKTDFRLMEHLFKIYELNIKYEIVSYNTNIYTLYNEMFKEKAPNSLDLLLILKEHERDVEKKKIFDDNYSDILLIFDLDPQDPKYSESKITKMMGYFIESSDMGKLYINYPMVEAFYHMKSIPDYEYDRYYATFDELKSHTYKQRVNQENRNRSYSKFAVNRSECNIVIRQNIDKAYNLLYLPDKTDIPESLQILETQLNKIKAEDRVAVLCTCAFFIPEYNRKLIEIQ